MFQYWDILAICNWNFFLKQLTWILCLWFRASLIYINNCPTRCNTKQSIYYSESSLYMFRVSTTPIMRTQNCNYNIRYWSCCAVQLPPSNVAKLPWPRWREVAAQKIWPVLEAVVTVLCSFATLEGGSCTKNMTSTGGCSYSFV